jgi:enoyl-CoA hydratase/carnithine racemase
MNATHPDEPALLSVDGPIATITLNRPAGFNSIDLSIAKKLEQLGAEVEASDEIRVLVIEGNGSAAGAGLSLAFVADLCIAAEDAKFTPAYAKLGVSPDGGGTVGVVASVGPRRALQIFLAEDSFSAKQAHDWGLVVKVVPAAELKAATRELALRLAQNAPAALAATKALIHRSHATPIEQQLDAERDAIIDCMHTDEFRAAVKKFTSKGK